MSELWFTSDEHYGHENILRFCSRPFKNIYENIDVLVKNHNSVVPKSARVYHLGDMFWRTLPLKTALDIVHSLNGQHYYIWGNHDQLMQGNNILREAFVWCKDIEFLEYQKQKIMLCHYAMRTWRNSHRGSWQLYGHTHGGLPEDKSLSFDVGVDAWNFMPVSFEQIKEKMDIKAALGHGDPMTEKIKSNIWDKTGDL